MENQRKNNGWQTFLEHWWFLFIAIIAYLASGILSFFSQLSGTPWICFFTASFALMITGGGLIAYAKTPVYRSGRFFTLGFKSVPERLKGFYLWGWRMFLFGVALSLCLFLSKP